MSDGAGVGGTVGLPVGKGVSVGTGVGWTLWHTGERGVAGLTMRREK